MPRPRGNRPGRVARPRVLPQQIAPPPSGPGIAPTGGAGYIDPARSGQLTESGTGYASPGAKIAPAFRKTGGILVKTGAVALPVGAGIGLAKHFGSGGGILPLLFGNQNEGGGGGSDGGGGGGGDDKEGGRSLFEGLGDSLGVPGSLLGIVAIAVVAVIIVKKVRK